MGCSMLQSVRYLAQLLAFDSAVVSCGVLQCIMVGCSVLQWVAVCCIALQSVWYLAQDLVSDYIAVCCSV